MPRESRKAVKAEMKVQMCRAAEALLGPGCTPDYYESAASEFIQIAEWYMDDATKTAREECKRRKNAAKA